jgi:hypothetical protein
MIISRSRLLDKERGRALPTRLEHRALWGVGERGRRATEREGERQVASNTASVSS